MRLEIEIDKMAKDIARRALDEATYEGKTLREWINLVKAYTEKDAPTIDAVPVVRCKDCKHFIHQLHACCDTTGAIVPMPYNAERFFCAHGERMDGDPHDSGQ